MSRQNLWRILLLLVLFLLSSCRKQEPVQFGGEEKVTTSKRPVVVAPIPILSNPMGINLHEVAVQALPELMVYRGQTLVLLANDPFLIRVPDAMRAEIDAVFQQGGSEFQRRLWRVADPLLTPRMLTGAAFDTHLFKRIIWVVPSLNLKENIDLEKIKALIKSLELPGSETFRSEVNGTITGEINGIRFDVVHPAALPDLTSPVVLHLDLGYFAAIYKNEIKTPLIPLVGETLVKLRNTKWPTNAVTFSYSNHTGQAPLSLRPLGVVIQRLFAEPQLLDQSRPENWQLLGKVLYLENFFQNEDIDYLLTRMEKNEPNAAWVKYLRANFSRRLKDEVSAERFLAEAIKGDVGYALEYMAQAEAAREEKNPELILSNLRKLVAAMPGDPLFQLSLCEELVEQKRFDEVRNMLPGLRQHPWSPVYYQDVPSTLEYFQKLADQ